VLAEDVGPGIFVTVSIAHVVGVGHAKRQFTFYLASSEPHKFVFSERLVLFLKKVYRNVF
jgi:hypothetical protein